MWFGDRFRVGDLDRDLEFRLLFGLELNFVYKVAHSSGKYTKKQTKDEQECKLIWALGNRSTGSASQHKLNIIGFIMNK